MLRSMFIGLAIAALLQVGVHTAAPAMNVSAASQKIDWVTVQAKALTRLLCDTTTLSVR
jgi:hypothetical protein